MHHTLNANGYEFAFIEAGFGDPLLFVHGSLLDYRYWDREVAHFSDRFRTVALSRRSHWPNTPEGEFSYNSSDQTDDVIAFIESLNLGSVHLVGHSYGGYIAARIACIRPELVKSLVLMEPGGPVEGENPSHSRIEDYKLAAQFIKDGEHAKGVAHYMDAISSEPKWQDGSETYKAMSLDNARTIIEQVLEMRPVLRADLLARITCPTLLMIGTHSISPFPETLDRLQSLITPATLIRIPNASHMINIDNHEYFIEVLSEFLAKSN